MNIKSKTKVVTLTAVATGLFATAPIAYAMNKSDNKISLILSAQLAQRMVALRSKAGQMFAGKATAFTQILTLRRPWVIITSQARTEMKPKSNIHLVMF